MELHISLLTVIQDTISCAQNSNLLRPDGSSDCRIYYQVHLRVIRKYHGLDAMSGDNIFEGCNIKEEQQWAISAVP